MVPEPKSSKTLIKFPFDDEMGFIDETGHVYTKVLDASAANGVRYLCAHWKMKLLEKDFHSPKCSNYVNYDDDVGKRCTYSMESTPNCSITEEKMKQRLERVVADSPSNKFSEFYENFAKLAVADNYFGGESFEKFLK